MEKDILLYVGNSKKIYATANSNQVIVYYTDEVNAFNGIKKAVISSKGIINNKISGIIFRYLDKAGVENHYIKTLDERRQLCRRLQLIPIEVIVRNIITGSMVKRLNVQDKTIPKTGIYELCYKDDKLGNPLINDDHVFALDLCTKEELNIIYNYSRIVNESLKKLFSDVGLVLVDFKLEFGRNSGGKIMLADEITPDSCRVWDEATGISLDKDRFRQDLGNVIEGYIEVLKRLEAYEKS